MRRKTLQLLLMLFVVSSLVTPIQAQVEYEGQRYLMENVYQIKSENFDKLKIDETIKEIEPYGKHMFVLTSYIFNEKSGVVITSFNRTNFSNIPYQFVNVHLTNDQYEDLYNTFKELEKNTADHDEHILRKFNDRLIVDVNNEAGIIYYTLWVDNHSQHKLTTSKWDRAYKRHKKFIE